VTNRDLEKEVLRAIRPPKEEEDHINDVARRLIERVRASGVAEAMVVGSVARNTWIQGDRDLDVFLLFDPALPREKLEQEGLALARDSALAFTSTFTEKYAEHPYINASIEGLDVDLVPCYRVASATEIKSAVDRTPFHTRYIQDKIQPYIDEVLLLKKFAKAGGVYGSDQMTEGFSGYLCELLILHYGGFLPLLNAASSWRPGTLIDIEGHRAKEFSEPLIVVDPVDPARNVSASVSLTRMFEFVELARGYIDQPEKSFFFPKKERIPGREEIKGQIEMRGTHLFLVCFSTPPFIADIVVPQLRKSLDSIVALLDRNGFSVHRADCEMMTDRSILLFELMVDRMPNVTRHMGPPLWNGANAEKFAAKYKDVRHIEYFSGPYIENGRYVMDIERRFTSAEELLKSHALLEVSLGKHVKKSMEEYWDVRRGIDCWSEEFGPFIADFLNRASPLMRIRREGEDSSPV